MDGERAKTDLERIPGPIRLYFEAQEKGTLVQYYLSRFCHFRDNYLDDLPAVDVRKLATLDEKGRFVGENYKCKGNYLCGLSATLQGAIENGVITDSELVEKIRRLRAHDFRFHHGEFTTQEENDMINQILNDVIGYLEGKSTS